MGLLGIKSSASSYSFYERNKAWRAKQKEHNERFLNQQSAATNLFAVGVSSQQSATELLFQKVVQRVQNEAKAKIDQRNGVIDKAIDSLDIKV